MDGAFAALDAVRLECAQLRGSLAVLQREKEELMGWKIARQKEISALVTTCRTLGVGWVVALRFGMIDGLSLFDLIGFRRASEIKETWTRF